MHLTHDQRVWLGARLREEHARVNGELAAIELALTRLEAEPERFGVDERTGEEIPFEQLMKTPWARTRASDTGSSDVLAADSDVLAADRNERYSG